MKLKNPLASLTLGGTLILLSLNLAACSTPAKNQQAVSPEKQTSMHQGMDHGSGSGMHDMTSMDLGPADESFELRFIDAMSPHHEGAVNMAREVLAKSKRNEVKQLAQAVISAQQKEIQQMKQWRKAWYPNASAEPMMYHAQMGHMMPMTQEQRSSMMMEMDLGAADAQFDKRFIDAMIPHHEGALVMAKEALEKSKRPEIQKLAQDIVESQQKEIDQMKQWRKQWYGS
jgi:uncharacterized protein (DUF305 family)